MVNKGGFPKKKTHFYLIQPHSNLNNILANACRDVIFGEHFEFILKILVCKGD